MSQYCQWEKKKKKDEWVLARKLRYAKDQFLSTFVSKTCRFVLILLLQALRFPLNCLFVFLVSLAKTSFTSSTAKQDIKYRVSGAARTT